jgi:septal ring factor EnvC (AmiA/AmiB activator)
MKNRIGVIVLVVICLALGIGLIALRVQSSNQYHADLDTITTLSNKWVKTSADLDEQRNVASSLEKDVEAQKKAAADLSNRLTRVSADLSQTSSNLTETAASLKAAQEEVAKRDARITELEAQNQALDKQAIELGTAITNLTTQISDTQHKLAASEGDKAFLQKELKRLMAEKAELERQFNDLAVLRAQVSRIKHELTVARRLDWIRRGIFADAQRKGAEHLMRGAAAIPSPQAAPSQSSHDLNVEVGADGSVHVVAPATNAPAQK